MKKLLLNLLLLSIIATGLYGQEREITYLFDGKYDNKAVELDSILIENLASNTRLLVSDLPKGQTSYKVKLLTTATGISEQEAELGGLYKELTNFAGNFAFQYQNKQATVLHVLIFDLQGREVFTQKIDVNYGEIIHLTIPGTGIHFVKLSSSFGTASFKTVAGNNISHFDMYKMEGTVAKETVKTHRLRLKSAKAFTFDKGDTLLLSVYKKDLYAVPQKSIITNNSSFSFKFKKDTENTTGVSNAYMPPEENNYTVESYNSDSEEAVISYKGSKPDIIEGMLIPVKENDRDVVVKVIKVKEEDGKIITKTQVATLADIFVGKELKLSTKMIKPQSKITPKSSRKDISKAFTDADGYIHPVEIKYYTKDKTQGKDRMYKAYRLKDDPVSSEQLLFDATYSFARTLYDKGALKFSLSEASVYYGVHAVLKMEMKDGVYIDENTKLKRKHVKNFTFYLQGDAKLTTKFAVDVKYGFKEDENDKLCDIAKVSVEFMVGPVPVVLDFDLDMYYKFDFAAEAALNANWGFNVHNTIKLGSTFDNINETFTPIKETKERVNIFPLKVSGETSLDARAELYPRVDVSLWGRLGPYVELAPYLQANHSAIAKTDIALGGIGNFIAWNSNIDCGLDMRTGINVDYFIGDKDFGEIDIPLVDPISLWKTPYVVSTYNNPPEKVKAGETIGLSYKVTDYLDFTVPFMPVYFSGGGKFKQAIALTDKNGIVTVEWTAPKKIGLTTIHAKIFNTKEEEIFTATSAIKVIPEDLAIENDKVVLQEGTTATVAVTAGSGIYTASSNNTGIATASIVDNNVTINAIAAGSAIITVTDTKAETNKTETIAVTVTAATPDLALANSTASVQVGKNATVAITAGSGTYTASSDDNDIVTASIAGNNVKITGVAEGTATVTVTDTETSKTKTIAVTVTTATTPDLAIDNTNVSVKIAKTTEVNITNGSGKYSVKSQNTKIATVILQDNVISITGKKAETTKVIVTDTQSQQTKEILVKVINNIIPTKGLVAYYPFNGNANDESGNNNNGTVYGATLATDRKGNVNRAYSFDGNSYIKIPYSTSMDLKESISIACWVKFNIPANYQHIVWHGDTQPGKDPYSLSIELDSMLQFRRDLPYSSQHRFSLRTFCDNEYHFFTATYENKSGLYKIFIDGVERLSSTFLQDIEFETNDMWTVIGGVDNKGTFIGSIDDIRIYNIALMEDEVLQLYNE